jgi:signal transduction histidine kinase
MDANFEQQCVNRDMPEPDEWIDREERAIGVDGRVLDAVGILDQTLQRLSTLELPVPVAVDERCRAMVEAIILEVVEELSAQCSARAPRGPFLSYDTEREHLDFGEHQAGRRAHPAEALIVADVLFDVALPQFVAWGSSAFGCGSVDVVRVLHHVIWRRFPAGAVGYTEGLRQRLLEADRESRLRVSRDLHDRVAHGIAAGIQRVELAVAERGSDAPLAGALEILRDSLDHVRGIATDLRRHVGAGTLEASLRELAVESDGNAPRIDVRVDGTRRVIPSSVEEEAFLVGLEAIRNAREHAVSACVIHVAIVWGEQEVVISVTDDGDGFNPHASAKRRGLGIHSMEERALNLGGVLAIESEAGRGTTVQLTIPHLGVAA